MKKYLGERLVKIEDSPYAGYTPQDWALEYADAYGWIGGDNHRQWAIDQMCRILHGTPVILKLAEWDDGTAEYRFNTCEPSQKYLDWFEAHKGCEYGYNEGTAP